MGFSAEQVSGFVAMIGILSMIAQVGAESHYTAQMHSLFQKISVNGSTNIKQ